MPEILKQPVGNGVRPPRSEPPFPGPHHDPHPSAAPDERCLVRLLLGERRGRVVTVILYSASETALSRLLLAQFPRLLGLQATGEEGRVVFPGDCRARLRAELRHRGFRVKG